MISYLICLQKVGGTIGISKHFVNAFWNILGVFSGLNDQIGLNPFASCQTSSGISVEYPHGVFWRDLKIAIFCPKGHLLGEFYGTKTSIQKNPVF